MIFKVPVNTLEKPQGLYCTQWQQLVTKMLRKFKQKKKSNKRMQSKTLKKISSLTIWHLRIWLWLLQIQNGKRQYTSALIYPNIKRLKMFLPNYNLSMKNLKKMTTCKQKLSRKINQILDTIKEALNQGVRTQT